MCASGGLTTHKGVCSYRGKLQIYEVMMLLRQAARLTMLQRTGAEMLSNLRFQVKRFKFNAHDAGLLVTPDQLLRHDHTLYY